MKKLSIKLRITLWYIAVLLVISIGLFFAMMGLSEEILIAESKSELERAVNEISNTLLMRRDNNRHMPDSKFFDRGVHIALLDDEKNVIGGFMPYDFAENMIIKDGEISRRTYNGEEFLIYSKKTNIYGVREASVVGVISVTEKKEILNNIGNMNALFIIFIILIAAVGGYVIIWKALRPIDKVIVTAKSISESNDLSERIMLGKGNDEMYRLADTFDKMLDKIETSFEKEKEFTSNASHELRTPVAVINSECEYVLDCAASLDDAKDSVLSIKRQSDKMSKLISELLAISRMDKENLKINFEDVDVSELLNFVCDEQEEIQDKSIKLHRNIEPEVHAKSDQMLIARMLVNLISNAYTYSKESGNIWISLCAKNNNVIIRVADDGTGISKEDISKIWDRFYRADKSRKNGDNLGLGLSIVKWIVEHHKGKITLLSELDKGTEFVVEIPINPDISA